MGFFSELKEDLSQAVNELVPDEEFELEDDLDKEYGFKAEKTSSAEALLEKAEAEFEAELGAMYREPVNEVPVREEPVREEYVRQEPVREEPVVQSPVVEVEPVEDKRMVASDEVSTITRNMIVNGDLEADGSLDLFGTVNGNIKVLGKLNVTGSVSGNSEAAEVYAQRAKIVGDITSLGSVNIAPESVIRGNIYATSAIIAGAVKGDIDVKGPVVLDSSAIVMGNIKSKSVQINNGAAIEGLCSQCYADVSPSHFFRD